MSKLVEILDTFFSCRLDSPESLRQYRAIVSDWVNFLGSEERVFSAVGFDCHRYVATIKKKKGIKSRYNADSTITFTTVKKYIDVLRSLYAFMVECNFIDHNPFSRPGFSLRQTRSDPKRKTEAVPFKYVQKIITLPGTGSKEALRDTGILMVLFGCGIRAGALQNLRLSDFRTSSKNTLFLRLLKGKTSYYEVAVPDEYRSAIESLLQLRYRETGTYESYVFTNYRGIKRKPTNVAISMSTLQRLFKRYLHEAGAPETCSIHSARATLVTKLKYDGKTNREIMQCTGHSNEQTVETYIWKFTGIDEQPNINLSYSN